MKKVIIIFAGVALALVGCKTQTDGLASAGVDDVYYNPARDRKPNVVPQPEQFTAKAADPNAGKIAATPADENNPYYKDPNFNYDDYYDNAYAARIRRFNNPIYGTGYYDTYNTNAYFYNGNPGCYGTSIYSSYNMGYGGGNYGNGWGYYSPSNSFWNAYYNPYYNGFGYGNGWNNGWSMGYGYNPYNYNAYGYGYNPYGYGNYSPYGYNPYGYGMGYGYNPMTYYNPYDYNSNSYSNYGPRGTHSGGNSTTTSPMPKPHHLDVSKPMIEDAGGNAPYALERFNHVSLPKDHFSKVQAVKSTVNPSPAISKPADGRPVYNNNGQGAGYSTGNTPANGDGVSGGRPVYNNSGYTQPSNSGNSDSRPRKWTLSGGDNSGGAGGSSNSGGSTHWNSSGSGSGIGTKGGNSGGGSNGSSSGGTFRPRK